MCCIYTNTKWRCVITPAFSNLQFSGNCLYNICLTLCAITRWWSRNIFHSVFKSMCYFHERLHKEYTRKALLPQCEVFLSSCIILHGYLSSSNVCTVFRPLLVVSLKCRTKFSWLILCPQSIHYITPAYRVLGSRGDVYEEWSGGLCPTAGCVSARAGR
jgi:hypothetical protein